MSDDNVTFRLGVAQTDCVLADTHASLDIIEEQVEVALGKGVDLLVFPELATSGYGVREQYSHAAIRRDSPEADRLRQLSEKLDLVVGFIEETDDMLFYNAGAYLSDGEVVHVHRKIYLPNYRIFDERRWFGAGTQVRAFDTKWTRMAILVCGDCWHLPLPYMAVQDGANVLLFLAASSDQGLTPKVHCREAWTMMNRSYAMTMGAFVAFSNRIGTEDPLRFWGGSQIVGPDGNVLEEAALYESDLIVHDLDLDVLRQQRLVLPFRRDDDLRLTIRLGKEVLGRDQMRFRGFDAPQKGG